MEYERKLKQEEIERGFRELKKNPYKGLTPEQIRMIEEKSRRVFQENMERLKDR